MLVRRLKINHNFMTYPRPLRRLDFVSEKKLYHNSKNEKGPSSLLHFSQISMGNKLISYILCINFVIYLFWFGILPCSFFVLLKSTIVFKNLLKLFCLIFLLFGNSVHFSWWYVILISTNKTDKYDE